MRRTLAVILQKSRAAGVRRASAIPLHPSNLIYGTPMDSSRGVSPVCGTGMALEHEPASQSGRESLRGDQEASET